MEDAIARSIDTEAMLWKAFLQRNSAFEGLVFTRYGGSATFTHPPEAVLADSDVFGEYVWFVQVLLQGGVPIGDAITPLLCSTCYTEARQASKKVDLPGCAEVHIFRLSREDASNQARIRYPRREAMEEVARRWANRTLPTSCPAGDIPQ